MTKSDRKILLDASDGPEGITIYTSEEEGVVDWAQTFPAVYITVANQGASAKFGPFVMPAIYQKLKEALRDGKE